MKCATNFVTVMGSAFTTNPAASSAAARSAATSGFQHTNRSFKARFAIHPPAGHSASSPVYRQPNSRLCSYLRPVHLRREAKGEEGGAGGGGGDGAPSSCIHTFGAGFLEKVYQRALLHKLQLRGIAASAEASIPVTYKGHGVGEYFADILVEEVLVIELKCAERLTNDHMAVLNTGASGGALPARQFPTQREWGIVLGFRMAPSHPYPS
ncbi:MAG: GxxExxY protein [Bryobacterales bacterium]|nr:GxxExxY protein [Bryobacterales bacterium]